MRRGVAAASVFRTDIPDTKASRASNRLVARGLACVALGIFLTIDLLLCLAMIANLALDLRAGQTADPWSSLRPLVNDLAMLVPTRIIEGFAPLLLPFGALAGLVGTRELRDSRGLDEVLRRESLLRPSMLLLVTGVSTLIPGYSSLPTASRARVPDAEVWILFVTAAFTVALVQLHVPCWKAWFAAAFRTLDNW